MMALRLTRTVKTLLITNVAVFVVQKTVDQFMGGNLLGWFGLVPAGMVSDFRFWQIFTYAFLHGDVMHLFFNMLVLAFIGSEIDAVWGRARFLRFYFICATMAGLSYLFMQFFVSGKLHQPMVGASGAIYGLLMAYGILFGERVMLFMLLFPMKAKYFVWILAGLAFMTALYSPGGTLSSVAHLTGMATGFLLVWGKAYFLARSRVRGMSGGRSPLVGSLRRKKKRQGGSGHLRLIINNNEDDEYDQDDHPDKGPGDPKTWH